MAPSRFRTAVAAAIRLSTGTCSAAIWPPMKLYLGKPVHLRAGGGVSGARRGATSKGAVMGGSSLACPNCWAKPARFATALTGSGHGAERMGVGHVPGQGPARRRRAAEQRAGVQRRVDVVEGHDLLRRDAAGNVDRLELIGMLQPGRRRQLGELMHGGAVEVDHALHLV